MTHTTIALAVGATWIATWLVRAWIWPFTRSGKPVRGSATVRRVARSIRIRR